MVAAGGDCRRCPHRGGNCSGPRAVRDRPQDLTRRLTAGDGARPPSPVVYRVPLFGKSRRRERLRAEPFPDHWRRVVETRVPVFARLNEADQRELLAHGRVLIEEKHFEGAGGLLMRDEVRLTIVAQAALLLLHRETDYFPRLTSVIVYPTGYVATSQHAEGGIWSEDDEHLSGHTQRNLRALVL